MKIGIVGMGLIGGSILKALKARTSHKCYAQNRTQSTLEKAKPYMDGILIDGNIADMDIVFVCLTPQPTIDYVLKNKNKFKKGSIVIDICGVKQHIIKNLEQDLLECGVFFIGGHPMAGKEVAGFDNSTKDLFDTASFILTPTERIPIALLEKVEQLVLEMGCEMVVKTDGKTHDDIIAYTSQLAHIVSNAYVKSPNLQRHSGFSAGSFQDLTRVARLDSKMWKDLFLINKKPLVIELDNIIKNLNIYKTALESEDGELLENLLDEGNRLKLDSLVSK